MLFVGIGESMCAMVFSGSDYNYALNKKRRYRKSGEVYSSDTHFLNLLEGNSSISVDYKVYFYEGDAKTTYKDSDGEVLGTEAVGVQGLFVDDGGGTEKCVSSYRNYADTEDISVPMSGKSREEIALDIKDAVNELNLLFPTKISFNYTGWETTTTDKRGKYSENCILIIRTGLGVNVAMHTATYPIFGGSAYIWMAVHLRYLKLNINETQGGFRHELGHVMAFAHTTSYDFGRNLKASPTDTLKYYNKKFDTAPCRSGLNAKTGVTMEDSVCMYDNLINIDGANVTRLFGTVSGTYPTGHAEAGNSFFEHEKGYLICRAYMYDSYTKELLYEVPIDYTGYFRFCLRILPPASVAHYILITSKEFCYSYKAYDSTLVDKKPDGVEVVYSNGSKVKRFKCIKTHTSEFKNKPLLGNGIKSEHWSNYWEELKTGTTGTKWKGAWGLNKNYKYRASEEPENGHIFYNIIGPIYFSGTSANVTVNSDNNLNTLISAGTIRGSLIIGGRDGNKKAESLEQLEDRTGVNITYTKDSESSGTSTMANVLHKLEQGESVSTSQFESVCNLPTK